MKLSWNAIVYRILLVITLVLGVVFVGLFLTLFAWQKNFRLTPENATGLAIGITLLICFYYYSRDRKRHPLHWEPKVLELSHDANCHRVSPLFHLRAIQKSSTSDSRPEDYQIEIVDFISKKNIPVDRSNKEHERLYQSFLAYVQSHQNKFVPVSYSARWNIAKKLTER